MTKKLEKIKTASSLWDKGFGVIGWKDWHGFNGLLLKDTTAIHTFFVRLTLDLVFLDQNHKIVRLVENLKPWSFSPIVGKAKHTLELPAGAIKKHSLKINDKISF